jgi:uncharacterized protein (DUF362 family)
MKRKEVVLIKETRQSEFVKKIMDTIAPYLTLKPSDKVAIKINLSGSREIYANTNYKTVESLVFYLRDNFGVQSISIIEGSDGAFFTNRTTWDVFYKFRYKEIELNGANLVNLDELPHNNILTVDTINGKKDIAYTTFDADYIITVVPPKTHNIFPVFLSIPNLIGFVQPADRVFMFGASNSRIKRINFSYSEQYFELIDKAGRNFIELSKHVLPSLVIIDGLYGMEGKGPIKGSPVFHGFAVASEDAVLADSLTTYIMGFDVDDVSYLNYAFYEGVGNNRWQNVIGVDPPQVKFPYRPHPLYPKQKTWKEKYFKQFNQNYLQNKSKSNNSNERTNQKEN